MKDLLIKLVAAIQLALAAGAVVAQDGLYPTKLVRLITPFSAGSGPDTGTRVIAAALSKQLGQSVVVENRAGSGDTLAAQAVAKSSADGYTLLYGGGSLLVSKHLNPDVGYDPFVDFAPITTTFSSGMVLTVRADSPALRAEDLVWLARSNPGKLNYASPGGGSPGHLSAATFQAVSGVNVVHVPFKGTAEPAMALLRGDVDYFFGGLANIQSHIAAGKMRVLAVTNAARIPLLPQVPTLREVLKSEILVQEFWQALWAPAKTPSAIVRKLHAATVKAMTGDEVRKQMESYGGAVVTSDSPEAFAAYMLQEDRKWKEIVRLAGAKAG